MRNEIPSERASLHAKSMQSQLRGSGTDVVPLPNRTQTCSGCIQGGNVRVGNFGAMFYRMVLAVFAAISQLQIFYAVVELVVILVVDYFRGIEFSSDVQLHYEAMFPNPPTVNCDKSIAVPCKATLPAKFSAKGGFWAAISAESEVMGIA